MTQALLCDSCGRIASASDPTDDDPAKAWWALSRGPTPGGGLLPLVSTATLDINISSDDDVVEPEPEDAAEQDGLEPELHFCGDDCLRAWVVLRASA